MASTTPLTILFLFSFLVLDSRAQIFFGGVGVSFIPYGSSSGIDVRPDLTITSVAAHEPANNRVYFTDGTNEIFSYPFLVLPAGVTTVCVAEGNIGGIDFVPDNFIFYTRNDFAVSTIQRAELLPPPTGCIKQSICTIPFPNAGSITLFDDRLFIILPSASSMTMYFFEYPLGQGDPCVQVRSVTLACTATDLTKLSQNRVGILCDDGTFRTFNVETNTMDEDRDYVMIPPTENVNSVDIIFPRGEQQRLDIIEIGRDIRNNSPNLEKKFKVVLF